MEDMCVTNFRFVRIADFSVFLPWYICICVRIMHTTRRCRRANIGLRRWTCCQYIDDGYHMIFVVYFIQMHAYSCVSYFFELNATVLGVVFFCVPSLVHFYFFAHDQHRYLCSFHLYLICYALQRHFLSFFLFKQQYCPCSLYLFYRIVPTK